MSNITIDLPSDLKNKYESRKKYYDGRIIKLIERQRHDPSDEDSTNIQIFSIECLEYNPYYKMHSGALFNAYQDWLDKNNKLSLITKKQFSIVFYNIMSNADIEYKSIIRVDDKVSSGFRGIKLKNT